MALTIPIGFGAVILSHVRTGDPDPYAVTFGVDLSDSLGDHQVDVNNICLFWQLEDQIYDSEVSLDRAILYVGQAPDPPLVFESTIAPVSGSGAGDFLPQNNACLVTKRTASSGRRNKGRFYLPYVLPSNEVDDLGNLSGAQQTGVQAAMTSFFNNLSTGAGGGSSSLPMVVLHGPGLGPEPAPTLVTSLFVEPVIATQRLRLRK